MSAIAWGLNAGPAMASASAKSCIAIKVAMLFSELRISM
jgi:hypothetical protein